MNSNAITINIAEQFSKYPGGRYYTDGPHSGQKLREELLVPALNNHANVIVEMDGGMGYGSGFLEEAFGGLVRCEGLDAEDLAHRLTIISIDAVYTDRVNQYIADAGRIVDSET